MYIIRCTCKYHTIMAVMCPFDVKQDQSKVVSLNPAQGGVYLIQH